MALAIKPPQDRKRVKVYELRDNDWYDRGTGFCTGAIVEVSLLGVFRRTRQSRDCQNGASHARCVVPGQVAAPSSSSPDFADCVCVCVFWKYVGYPENICRIRRRKGSLSTRHEYRQR